MAVVFVYPILRMEPYFWSLAELYEFIRLHAEQYMKAGEQIQILDIHVGSVQAHRPHGINRVDFLR